MPDYQTPDPIYAEILKALGVPQDVIAQGGMWQGIPTNPAIRPAGITPQNTWGVRTKAQGLPAWASMILGTAPKLSPESQKKLYRHWVSQEGIAPQWKDVAAARPAWATELMKQQFASQGITG